MEIYSRVRDEYNKKITSLGHFIFRRELWVGFEDGSITNMEIDSGKYSGVVRSVHLGRVTCFAVWNREKMLLSGSLDGRIASWVCNNEYSQVVNLKVAVYSLCVDQERDKLFVGTKHSIRLHQLLVVSDEPVDPLPLFIVHEHGDIVSCMVLHENRLYTAGYNQNILIYEYDLIDSSRIQLFKSVNRAHEAGITSLLVEKDNEIFTWIVTGSFDKIVKIWTIDGKLIHRLSDFLYPITGIGYSPKLKVLWIIKGSPHPGLYDLKTGEDVTTSLIDIDADLVPRYYLQLCHFVPELNVIFTTTSDRHVITWKYESSTSITILPCRVPIDVLTYTSGFTNLIFGGDDSGKINKWEQKLLNSYSYVNEEIAAPTSTGRRQFVVQKKPAKLWDTALRIAPKMQSQSVTSILYINEYDVLVIGRADGLIDCWGYDAVALKMLTDALEEDNCPRRIGVLLPDGPGKTIKKSDFTFIKQLVGLSKQFVLEAHSMFISGFCALRVGEAVHLVSCSWDVRVCVWDLEARRNVLRVSQVPNLIKLNGSASFINELLLTDVAHNGFCGGDDLLACSSTIGVVVNRIVTSDGRIGLESAYNLVGHSKLVTRVRWNPKNGCWVTASEDGTIRIWRRDECIGTLACGVAITTLCIDTFGGFILAAIGNSIKVWDTEKYCVVKTYKGHRNVIKDIEYIPEKNQYVSSSDDLTIRLWDGCRDKM